MRKGATLSEQPTKRALPPATPLQAEVAKRFGVLPNFFRLAPEAPEITANLWGFAKFGYLDNPLPSLFKERLFVYLSRFCQVRYCITRHLGFLIGLGHPSGDQHCPPETIEQVIRLISRPVPRGEAIESHLALLQAISAIPSQLPKSDTPAEEAIFACASHVFLQTAQAGRCLDALRHVFDPRLMQHLMVFLAFVRTAHFWTRIHPELSIEDDLETLLATQEALAQCLLNDPEAAACDTSESLLDELSILRDGSGRSRVELERVNRALAESESFSRGVFECSPDCVKVLDRQGRLTRINANGLRAMEIDDFAPLAGRPWCDLWPEERRGDVQAALQAARSGGIGHFEGFRPTAKGDPRWWGVSVSPIRSADGKLAGFVSVSRDITDRKHLEDEREAHLINQQLLRETAEGANRAKDRFLAALSHELRTPLMPVLMTAAALEQREDLPPELRADLAMISRNVELQSRLIDDLLDLSRIISGKLRLSFEIHSINDLLRHACDTCRPAMRERGIQLYCDLDPAGFDVLGDGGRLQQVFWNLLNNATKFTPEGGQVYVRSENIAPPWGVAQGGGIRLSVRDTGVGIPPEALERIFDAFEQGVHEAQGEAITTREFGGMGLGLAICRALVNQHGGTIRAHSEGKDAGSMFIVELPALANAAEVETQPQPRPLEVEKLRPLHLLIVEDHADTAAILGRLLTACGHIVQTATTATDALKLAAQHNFDIMVSDLGLPDMTGYELMRQIKQLNGTRGIAMSGYGMEEDIRKSEEAGFSDHLTKPLKLAQLEQSLRKVDSARDRSPAGH